MRLAGRERLGFYPLPIPEAERIRRFLRFPDQHCSVLDPCIGDGVAFAEITSDKRVSRYGVELDAGRAEQARGKVIEVIHGNCFDVQCPVESFSLIYLNPPYDFEIGEERSQRMEQLFLEHAYRWLKPGGILVLVDFAPHTLEFLRDEHAHRRLGFSDIEVAEWCCTAGLDPAPSRHLAGDPLTVVIWTARRPAASKSRFAEDVRDETPAALLEGELH